MVQNGYISSVFEVKLSKKIACSKEFEEKCCLKEKVEDNLIVDLFNQLDDNETDIEQIAKQAFKILWET